ncbi:hypothetical protein ACLBXM_13805 [Xanthobacteraceae bacterium A53D]
MPRKVTFLITGAGSIELKKWSKSLLEVRTPNANVLLTLLL